jgi:hypothetical protein
LDVKHVVLHGPLQGEMYMESQPKSRFVDQGKSGNNDWRFKKSLYREKTIPKAEVFK